MPLGYVHVDIVLFAVVLGNRCPDTVIPNQRRGRSVYSKDVKTETLKRG